MKDVLNKLLIIVIGFILTSAIAYYGFLQKKTELKYTISESISLNKNNDSSVSVQQLRISNTGDLPITTIVIKIKSKIIDYYVQKYKDSDSMSITKESNYFELVYPLIPKENTILLNLYTSESNIINDKIEITHSDGKAIEAFQQNDLISTFQVISWVILIIQILIFGYSAIATSISNYLLLIDISKTIRKIKRKKPWYLFHNRWETIKYEALNNLFKKDYNSDIEKTASYVFLTSDKTEFFTEDEWIKYKELAVKSLKEHIITSITSSYKLKVGELIYNISKPKYCSDTSWQSIIDKMSELYHIGAVNYAIYLNTPETTKKLLSEKKPTTISEEYWTKIQKSLEDIYAYKIVSNGTKWSVLDKYLKEIDLSILSDERKEQIEKIFSEIISGKENKENYSWLAHHIKRLPYQNELMEKPDNISEKDWKEFIEIHNTFVKVKNDTENTLRAIERENAEITPLRIKATKQLEIIDNLLYDPKSIDKVEEYNIPFNTGNWENLLRIKDILSNK